MSDCINWKEWMDEEDECGTCVVCVEKQEAIADDHLEESVPETRGDATVPELLAHIKDLNEYIDKAKYEMNRLKELVTCNYRWSLGPGRKHTALYNTKLANTPLRGYMAKEKKRLVVCNNHGENIVYYNINELDVCPLCDAMAQLIAIDYILNPHLNKRKPSNNRCISPPKYCICGYEGEYGTCDWCRRTSRKPSKVKEIS